MLPWEWVRVVLAVLVGLALPLIVNAIFNRWEKKNPKSAHGSGTLKEYLAQGLNELDAKFQVGIDFVATQTSVKLTNEQQLTLYAFYKQANLGKCTSAKPSAIDFAAHAKWESWSALGEMPKDLAKQQYLGLVKELFPQFDETGETHVRGPHPLADKIKGAAENANADANGMGMSGVVSMPTVDMSTPEWQVKEDLFHFASTGALDKVEAALARGEGTDVDAQDDEGRTMLHWAVDRSQRQVVELLLQHKASPNVQDSDGMTPLHYAVSCEDEELAQLLMNHGALADMEDNDGETPMDCAQSKEILAILSKEQQPVVE